MPQLLDYLDYRLYLRDFFRAVFVMFVFVVMAITPRLYAVPAFNYGEALQKAIYFYEYQQSGPLPAWNRSAWRGPSCVKDGADVGKDLSGGWYDAGDHVKFNFPMAFTVTMLCWGVKEYRDAYEKSGQLPFILNTIRFTADYLIKCHTAPAEFYGQVGSGSLDHSFWGPAESVEAFMARPFAKIDASHPGSDLAGEAAAALAAVSMIFKPADPTYAAACLTHARQLYDFADTYRGKYDAAIPAASGFYSSWSGYNDELVWGALWLYMATGESEYLAKAESYYPQLSNEQQTTTKSYRWTIAWDDKSYGCYCLLALLTGKQNYKEDTQRWLDYWTIGVNGMKIHYTPGGLAWLDTWGSNRYAANTAFVAFVYSDHIDDTALKSRYHDFAVKQIDYMLGNNPLKRSLVVGFGNNPPTHEHHRTAAGMYPGDASDTAACKHVLYGALVGGPGSNDEYADVRNNYTNNEVACDYNAAYTCALARMYKEFGGTPLREFPAKEPVTDQFSILASVNATGDRFTEIKATLYNITNSPARVCTKLSYRYFIDIGEVLAAGYSANQITITTNYVAGKAKVSPLQPWSNSSTILYVEISYTSDTLFPGTRDTYRREAQFRLSLPDNAKAGSWDPTNDWSYSAVAPLGQPPAKAPHFALYDDGKLLWGAEPGPGSNTVLRLARPSNEQRTAFFTVQQGKILAHCPGVNNRLEFFSPSGKLLYSTPVPGDFSLPISAIGNGFALCVVTTAAGKRTVHPIVVSGR